MEQEKIVAMAVACIAEENGVDIDHVAVRSFRDFSSISLSKLRILPRKCLKIIDIVTKCYIIRNFLLLARDIICFFSVSLQGLKSF